MVAKSQAIKASVTLVFCLLLELRPRSGSEYRRGTQGCVRRHFLVWIRFWAVALQEGGIGFAGYEIRVGHYALVQGNGGVDAFDHEHFERAAHAGDRLGAIVAVSD